MMDINKIKFNETIRTLLVFSWGILKGTGTLVLFFSALALLVFLITLAAKYEVFVWLGIISLVVLTLVAVGMIGTLIFTLLSEHWHISKQAAKNKILEEKAKAITTLKRQVTRQE